MHLYVIAKRYIWQVRAFDQQLYCMASNPEIQMLRKDEKLCII